MFIGLNINSFSLMLYVSQHFYPQNDFSNVTWHFLATFGNWPSLGHNTKGAKKYHFNVIKVS